MILDTDTICALATAPGGAINIVRLSGKDAISITDQIFRPASGKPLMQAQAQTVHYGAIHAAQEEYIDEVLISVFRAPHSYTGEDCVEISCHASTYIVQRILELLIHAGCRQARPGEYTQRAFLNGKMDLSQAEAVADVIAASNQASHRVAISQLRGCFSSELASLREQLVHLTSLLELELDFSDHEDLEFADRTEILELAQSIDHHIAALLHSFRIGNAIKQGIPVAIVGHTNVGKSTLLNRLVHEDKAIVSDIPGTTRDIIEDTVTIQGVTFRFFDTAGLRLTDDKVEQLGIERAYRKLDEAVIILWVIDEQPNDSEIQDIKNHIDGKQLIIVHNKIDMASEHAPLPTTQLKDLFPDTPVMEVSAKLGTNIPALEQQIFKAADIPAISQSDVIVTNMRHVEALQHALTNIQLVIDGIHAQLSGDLLSEHLRDCIHNLNDILGISITSSEVLQSIFSHYCIGK